MPPEPSAVAATAPGLDGFLGTRASLGMDVVLVGLVALLPVLAWSVSLARRGRYLAHKRLQLFIVAALLAAIVVFEIDIRLISDWKIRRGRAALGPAAQRLVADRRGRGPRHPPRVRRLHARALGVGGLGSTAAVSRRPHREATAPGTA